MKRLKLELIVVSCKNKKRRNMSKAGSGRSGGGHLVLLVTWLAGVQALREVQLLVPSAVSMGDTVMLSCKWSLEHTETLYSVKWYRGRQEFFRYIPKELPHTRVFPQAGINVDISRSGPQQVVLRGATRALAGRYRCEVSADAPSFHTEVRSAFIHVVELPESPPTLRAEKGWYAAGTSLRAHCSSPPADPPANLTWLLNGRDIQGKPVIQQRILPSPAVSIDRPFPAAPSTSEPSDDNTNLIFSPWKAFGPYVDNSQGGDTLLTNTDADVKVKIEPEEPKNEITRNTTEETTTELATTAEVSNRLPSVSQLSFMVRPDSFERGRLTLTCISSVHAVYSARAELVIEEERPQIGASVLGNRDATSGALWGSSPVSCALLTALLGWNLRLILR